MYHHPALTQALAHDRVVHLHASAQLDARRGRERVRPSVAARARHATGWVLVEMGLRLAVPASR